MMCNMIFTNIKKAMLFVAASSVLISELTDILATFLFRNDHYFDLSWSSNHQGAVYSKGERRSRLNVTPKAKSPE
jgi:hypothetical protein